MSPKPITIKITGPAGMGIKSGGMLLSKTLLAHGFNLLDYSEYPSLVRGGHNTYQLSFSPQKIYAVNQTVDLFFSLAPHHHQQHQSEFHSKTLVFTPQNLPLDQLSPKVSNIICLGITAFLFNLDKKICRQLIKTQYPNFFTSNLKAFNFGLDYAKNNLADKTIKLSPPSSVRNQKLYDGNQAFSWGFIQGGGNFYAAYPMTPSSGVLHTLALLQRDHHLSVVHPEDEIAAASLAAGAAFAGARSAVGTSGGGFALMNETISFCGAAEIGVVFYLVSRPGPASGMPTWTSQADLLYAIRAGHGDFPKVVLAASDQQDSFDMGAVSLNLAAQLQTPIIVLSDKFIAESSVGLKDLSTIKTKIKLGKILSKTPANFKRYNWSVRDGISPRTLPGVIGGEFIANSYEHDQLGFSTEDIDTAVKMRQKRAQKLTTALKLCPQPIFLGSPSAKKLIISWGSTKGPILQALSQVKDKKSFALLHLRTLWPINPNLKLLIRPFKKVIVVENNQSGQLTQLLKSQFDFNPDHQILKFDGRPFFPEELVSKLKKL